jgi:hypothetical protein
VRYVSLAEALYEYLNHVTKNHMVFVIRNLTQICFVKLFELIILGLKSDNMKIMTDSASSLSQICEYIIRIKPGEEMNHLQAKLSTNREMVIVCLQTLIEMLILEDNNYLWMISKPLLGLIIILEHNYREVLEFVLSRELKEFEVH